MSLLRAVADDLRDKRLWPVALCLVVALVAVPVVLGRSASAPATPLPDLAAQEAPVSGSSSVPIVLRETPRRAPTGPAHDPFRPGTGAARAKAPVQEGVAVVTPDPPAPAPAAGEPASAPADPPAGVAPAAAEPVAAPAEPVSVPPRENPAAGYRVDLSWGPTAAPRGIDDAVRLTPLAGADGPALVFMGVRPDGESALFLLLDEATGSGDARCRPTADFCRLIELRAGETQFLDLPGADGIRQYELHVDRLVARRARTEAAAKRLLDRVSKAGRRLVADSIDSGRTFARRYVYAAGRGVVVFSTHRPAARATGAAVGGLEAVGGPAGQ